MICQYVNLPVSDKRFTAYFYMQAIFLIVSENQILYLKCFYFHYSLQRNIIFVNIINSYVHKIPENQRLVVLRT